MLDRDGNLIRRLLVGAMALALAGLLTTLVFATSPAARSFVFPSNEQQGYAVGDTLTVLPAAVHLARRNVILFSRHGCGACQRSKIHFLGLVAGIKDPSLTQVIMVAPVPVDEAEVSFGREIGLEPAQIFGVSLRGTPIRHVPSVAVVDQDGKILMFHEGVLTEESRGALADTAAG